MKTVYDRQSISTALTVTDRKVLSRIVGTFSKLTELPVLGHYRTMTAADTWLTLVGQVCVMGSARHLERIHENAVLRRNFDERVSFGVATRKRRSLSCLSDTLRIFGDAFSAKSCRFFGKNVKVTDGVSKW